MSICVCVCVCGHGHMYGIQTQAHVDTWRPEEGIQSLGSGVSGSC